MKIIAQPARTGLSVAVPALSVSPEVIKKIAAVSFAAIGMLIFLDKL